MGNVLADNEYEMVWAIDEWKLVLDALRFTARKHKVCDRFEEEQKLNALRDDVYHLLGLETYPGQYWNG